MAIGSSDGGQTPLSEINVTPLVDVMLVLLVIFMVTAPLLTAGVEVDLPRADAPPMEMDEEKLLLSIDAEQHVFLQDSEVRVDALEPTLLENRRLQEDKELYVQADAAVPYGFVVRVLAIVRKAGIEQMGLVTSPMGAETSPTTP